MQTIKLLFTSALLNLCIVAGTLFFYAGRSQSNMFVQNAVSETPASTVSAVATEVPTQNVVKEIAPTQTNPIPLATATPTAQPKQAAPQEKKQLAGGCLVKIHDGVYDLAEFKKIHSGGDIFQCNSDMTSIFSQTHPQSYLNQIAKYRVQ